MSSRNNRPPRQRKNKARTRVRPGRYSYVERLISDNTVVYDYSDNRPSETMKDFTLKPCNLSVVKEPSKVIEGVYGLHGTVKRLPHTIRWRHEGNHFWLDPSVTTYCWTPFVSLFKHKKLPTSNDLDLLTSLAEFDDTVAMLARPTKPTYGSVKWGWMPLVSDIMAVNDAAAAVKASHLDGNRRTSSYNATHQIQKNSVDVIVNDNTYFHQWDVKVKHIGSITYENDILAFYDYMGFHPSPKILWDLVPLSFAVDYILPIGDMLKAITPSKGWVKSANFTGWVVITAKVTEKCKPNESWISMPTDLCERTFVTRTYHSGIALESKQIPRSIQPLKTPTYEQIFDLTYLADAFYQRAKKILSPHVYKKKK